MSINLKDNLKTLSLFGVFSKKTSTGILGDLLSVWGALKLVLMSMGSILAQLTVWLIWVVLVVLLPIGTYVRLKSQEKLDAEVLAEVKRIEDGYTCLHQKSED